MKKSFRDKIKRKIKKLKFNERGKSSTEVGRKYKKTCSKAKFH